MRMAGGYYTMPVNFPIELKEKTWSDDLKSGSDEWIQKIKYI